MNRLLTVVVLTLLCAVASGLQKTTTPKKSAGGQKAASAKAAANRRATEPFNKEAAALLNQAGSIALTMPASRTRASNLVKVAAGLCNAGDRSGSRKFSAPAAQAVAAYTPEDQYAKRDKQQFEAELGLLDACQGDVSGGLAKAEAAAEQGSNTVIAIAVLQARRGDVNGAVATAQRITTEYDADEAIEKIIAEQIVARDFGGALRNVELLRRSYRKMDALAHIRQHQVKLRMGAASLATLDRMRLLAQAEPSLSRRPSLHAKIIRSLGEANDTTGCYTQTEAAIRTLAEVPTAKDFISGAGAIAESLAETCANSFGQAAAGKALSEAETKAATVPKEEGYVYGWLAKYRIARGETTQALALIEKIPVKDYTDENRKQVLRGDVAVAEAKKGDLSAALQRARAIRHSLFKAQTLINISKAIAGKDPTQAAALVRESDSIFQEAEKLAAQNKDPLASLGIVLASGSVIEGYIEAGDLATACRMVVRDRNPFTFARTLAKKKMVQELSACSSTLEDAAKVDLLISFAETWLSPQLED